VNSTLTDGTGISLSEVSVTTSSTTLSGSGPNSTNNSNDLCQLVRAISSASLTTITSNRTLVGVVIDLLDNALRTL